MPSSSSACLLALCTPLLASCRGPEQQQPHDPESEVDRETAKLALRLLTARATAVVLQNVGQVNTFQAAWLNEYCQRVRIGDHRGGCCLLLLLSLMVRRLMTWHASSIHPCSPACRPSSCLSACVPRTQHPPLEGNAFLAALMQAKPEHRQDPYTGSVHHINPAALAAAILSTREALGQQLAKALPGRVADANIAVMRAHLENYTYTSGTNLDVKPSFRQYRGRSSQQRQLQQ